jgi:hypothetical protein
MKFDRAQICWNQLDIDQTDHQCDSRTEMKKW